MLVLHTGACGQKLSLESVKAHQQLLSDTLQSIKTLLQQLDTGPIDPSEILVHALAQLEVETISYSGNLLTSANIGV